ncbi:hypothetical protein D6U17_10795 [Lactiplantibacillus pentosus]|uniref:Uncharacterized protein n=1 Tax=Lactiplantibacillus pentosus TaxID=1589 RepID=A0AB37RG24_LACPE|nr:hypothetical protein D6U19_10440 [Lactiplantibacillus pentosus]RMW45209.1 hypothetical protein D6U20_08720 [Lactiplantibacillus pentosus]RMW53582.1 hypothetical protein D6U21_11090 [Lactiplantibacillus pentosus]RMW53783.1 hypothetical protein D6U17_10795 [Lactiplantibacillus pentosus]
MNQQLFINASQNQNGNTAALGRRLLENIKYKQINLVDYHIHQIGQVSAVKGGDKMQVYGGLKM